MYIHRIRTYLYTLLLIAGLGYPAHGTAMKATDPITTSCTVESNANDPFHFRSHDCTTYRRDEESKVTYAQFEVARPELIASGVAFFVFTVIGKVVCHAVHYTRSSEQVKLSDKQLTVNTFLVVMTAPYGLDNYIGGTAVCIDSPY